MVNRVFKLIILSSLTGILYFLQFSNRLALLINPRFFILIIFSQLFLALFIVLKLEYRSSKSKFKKSYILFIIMNVFLLLPSYEQYQKNITKNRSVNFSSTLPDVETSESQSQLKERKSIYPDVPESINLTSEDYMITMMDLYTRPDQYIGKKIFTKGFLYFDDQIGKENSIIARLAMICCAADASVYGVLIDGRESYIKDQWYDIEGTITYENISVGGKESKHPVIIVDNAVECNAPEDPYVY